jgi:hypothetical protein
MKRSILGVLGGVVLGIMLVFLLARIGHAVYPTPDGFDFHNQEAVKDYLAANPGVLLFVLAAHIVGPLAGAWLAAWIARRRPLSHALVVGVLFLAAGIANMLMIPHPPWFWLVDLLVYLPAALAGGWLAGRRQTAYTISAPSS